MAEPLPNRRIGDLVPAGVRILLGLMWLQNVGWKIPPNFAPVANFVNEGIEHEVFPPFSWVLEQLAAPNIELFGWGVLLSELGLAAFLLAGLATRLWAVIGVLSSVSIGLTVAAAPNEWGWSYWLMIAAHLVVATTPAAGRIGGLDGVLRPVVERTGPTMLGTSYLRWAS
ncbi:MAG: TQO small subunit DoxD [Acidimicrobiales bacterium]|nr:TQO small subunit DoxD [Acidimicrobiales bacterium]